MVGGAGNDAYYVDNTGDMVVENSNEGTDTVFSTAHLRLTENVEYLVLQGSADLQGYGNSDANVLIGNAGSNLLDGRGGADVMRGRAGNDIYVVVDAGDMVIENANEGTDAVFATIDYTLTANVETLVLQGSGNLAGTGNGLANKLFGNSGDNTLDDGAGADRFTGNAGNDTFGSTPERRVATSSPTSPATARRRETRSSSSASAQPCRAPRLPRLARPTSGWSIPASAAPTRPSRC
jgi:Ca2+-binding RTX toxin-like protein